MSKWAINDAASRHENEAHAEAMVHLLAPGPARPLLPLVVPVLESLGFQLVRVRITGEDTKMIMQVMAERENGSLRIEDCETISHALSAMLDVEEPMMGAYDLEVSSPGVARPLTRPLDFEHWAGHEAKLELLTSLEGGPRQGGQRRFRGFLQGFVDGEVRLQLALDGYDAPQVLGFALSQIAEARLIADETALKQALKAGKRNPKKSAGRK